MTSKNAIIRALVVDDEPLARRGIAQLLEAHPDVIVERECSNGHDALLALDALSPDLLFLDIQMPELDGFGVMREARSSRTTMPVTVFLTAYEEFALDAFDVEALDYLVKPVSDERFESAMLRVRRRIHEVRSAAAPAGTPVAAVPAAADSAPARHLIIPTARGQLVVSTDEIEWIAAEDYYVAVHARGKRLLLRETMSSLEGRLDRTRFVRVHRGAIVNVGRVRQIRTVEGETTVTLQDGTRLPVSRRRRAALSRALG